MDKSEGLAQKQLQDEEAVEKLPPQDKDPVAWESNDGNFWIPFRIRGSWRGGALG